MLLIVNNRAITKNDKKIHQVFFNSLQSKNTPIDNKFTNHTGIDNRPSAIDLILPRNIKIENKTTAPQGAP